jgi:hypothetical protein
MGAKHSCCAYSSPRTGQKKEKGRKEKERQEERYEPRQVSRMGIATGLLRKPDPTVGSLKVHFFLQKLFL